MAQDGHRAPVSAQLVIEEQDGISGERLATGQAFCFACRPGLSCFNSCCSNKRLPLLPYDVLRLKKALGMDSAGLLAEHVELESDPGSGWPALRIRLKPDGVCPFVSEQGCTVYGHRPTCCRIYPLARAVKPRPGGEVEEVFLKQDAPGCLGWQEPEELTTDDWVAGQGLADYHRANNYCLRLFMHPARKGKVELNQQQTHAFITALYNLEMFAQLVQQDGFAARFGIDPARLQEALSGEEALLRLSVDWLAGVLFGRG